MKKHTKGPWIAKTNPHIGGTSVFAGNAYIALIGQEKPFSGELDANAALISAAPEMLEALEGVLKNINDDDWLERVRAAVAKARGEK